MYDLEKIVIVGNFHFSDREGLNTIVMKTDGLKVESVLCLCDMGTTSGDPTDVQNDILSELYSDQYDDDLKIKVKEVINGEDAVIRISDFISKYWNENTLLYYYDPTDKVFDKLHKELEKKNGHIYLTDFYDLFNDGHNIDKDIYDIMKEQGLKTENLIKDSQVSLAYFLSALVEKILSK